MLHCSAFAAYPHKSICGKPIEAPNKCQSRVNPGVGILKTKPGKLLDRLTNKYDFQDPEIIVMPGSLYNESRP
jgi:hypothetical protein